MHPGSHNRSHGQRFIRRYHNRGVVHVGRRPHKRYFLWAKASFRAGDVMVSFLAQGVKRIVAFFVHRRLATLMVSEIADTARLPAVANGRTQSQVITGKIRHQKSSPSAKFEMSFAAQGLPIVDHRTFPFLRRPEAIWTNIITMASVTRRSFTASLVAPVLASAAKLRKSNLGVQIYTVRNILANDPAKVLRDIHAIGYTELEATADTLAKNWPAIEASGLKRVSAHLNTKPTDEQFADVKAKGFQYAVVPYIPPDQRGGVDVMKKLAASLQDSGKRASAHGLQLCYHTHAFEYQPMEGTTPFEILMGETDAALVKLELDIFWAVVAGRDPVEILGKHKGRVPLIHLKDEARGMLSATQYNEKVPKELFKEVGSGSLDIPAVLKAANEAGVQHYFVEQDQSPDAMASLRSSYAYLKTRF